MSDPKGSRLRRLRRGVQQLGRGAANALELLREGRLGAPWSASCEVLAEGPHHRLRRYAGPEGHGATGPLLLVPPLMVAAEIYDISPELSAVNALLAQGVDVWICDFGAPERQDGGMERTLDDHVMAVVESIRQVGALTGRPVHMAGYSQGGMFAYQAAAWLRGEGLASLITFGSPVDLRRAFPVPVHEELAERLLRSTRSAVRGPLQELEGLPSLVTAGGFKLLSPRKELQQLVELFGLLPDRGALERREPRRRFLNGEGFVAWPGPAFRQFVEQMVTDNRMTAGGFVIAGRTCTLADLRLPILAFVGLRDELARPGAVRGIERAAPEAEVHLAELPVGHFGLVVGSVALAQTWPTVAGWLEWRSGAGERPALLQPDAAPVVAEVEEERGVQALYDVATELMDGVWHRLGNVSLEVAGVMDTLRWQLPRLARLRSLHDNSRISLSSALQEQAESIPDATFFLWQGRAFTWAEANERVNAVLAALLHHGMQPGQHVGVFMGNRPDHLTVTCAINRAGAVGALLDAELRGLELAGALEAAAVAVVVCDPERLEAALDACGDRPVLVLGARRDPALALGAALDLDARLQAPDNALPEGFKVDAGLARDVALLMFTAGSQGPPQVARITNRRWALGALASAAACRLTSGDTVYCGLPLHRATGMLVAVGSALVGGARLALAPGFEAATFWSEVRRYGVTVAFYAGGMGRALLEAPTTLGERRHPLRLLVGSGMRGEVQQQLQERFGAIKILEYYATTEGNVALMHLSGDKPGALGRPVLELNEVELVRVEPGGAPQRDDLGRCVRCEGEEPGLLLARVEASHPMTCFDGYLSAEATEASLVRGAFAPGDSWFNTRDLLRRDDDGDFWFVERL